MKTGVDTLAGGWAPGQGASVSPPRHARAPRSPARPPAEPMHVRFAERVPADGVVRCVRCGHEVIVGRDSSVPRCYCGGHDFAFHATAMRDPSSGAPLDARPHRDDDRPARDPR
jgi:hypothetical protein